jgi:hypothetical protein
VSSPDVWESAANVATVVSILGLGIVPAAWFILTTPHDASSDRAARSGGEASPRP